MRPPAGAARPSGAAPPGRAARCHRRGRDRRAPGRPDRAGILAMLGAGPHCVCEMAAALGERENNVSNHLAKLRDAGLVRASRHVADARWIYYERDEAAGRRARGARSASCDDHARRPPRPRPVLALGRRWQSPRGSSPGSSRSRWRTGSPTTCSGCRRAPARRRRRVLPVRRAQGAAAADRHRDARHLPALVRVARAGAAALAGRGVLPGRSRPRGSASSRRSAPARPCRCSSASWRPVCRWASRSRSSSPRRWSTRSRWCCCGACSARRHRDPTWSPGCRRDRRRAGHRPPAPRALRRALRVADPGGGAGPSR